MINIFDKLKQKKAETVQSDLAAYYAFLAKLNVNDPSDDEQQTLDGFMTRLGKTIPQVQADCVNVQKLAELVKVVSAVKYADLDKQATKTYEAHQAVLLERQQNFQTMNAKVTAALIAMEQANADRDGHAQSTQRLREIKEADPVLFSAVVGDAEKKIKL